MEEIYLESKLLTDVISIRRTYDRELEAQTTSNPAPTWPSQSYPYYYDPSSMYETRRRGASYAWENARRSRARTSHQPPPPPFAQYPFGNFHQSSPKHPHEQPTGRDPFSSAHVRRATGRRTPFETREDRLRKEPVVVRIGQVLGLMFFIVALSGGFGSRR